MTHERRSGIMKMAGLPLIARKESPIYTQLPFTGHMLQRMAERNFTTEQIAYVLRHGKKTHRAGGVWFVLRRRDIPPGDLRNDQIARMVGVIVLVLPTGVHTAYRTRAPLRHIGRKAKYDKRKRDRERWA